MLTDRAFNNFLALSFIKKYQLREGITGSRCAFCDDNQGYYHFNDVQYKTFTEANYSYNYYICEDTVKHVFQYIEILLLIRHLCVNYIDYDVYKYMTSIYHNTHTKAICIIQREKLLEKRVNYLNIDLTNMTNKELRLLMNERKIKINGCKVKADYINKIKNDIEIKKFIWCIH